MFDDQKKKYLFWSIEILIVVGIIYLCTQMGFLFAPIGIFFSSIFLPLLIAGILYYMLSPLVYLLTKIKINGKYISYSVAAMTVFFIFILTIILILSLGIPYLIGQVTVLFDEVPKYVTQEQKDLSSYLSRPPLNHFNLADYIGKFETTWATNSNEFLAHLSKSTGEALSTVMNAFTIIGVVPLILFFFLKDSNKYLPWIENLDLGINQSVKAQIIELLKKMNDTLSRYITGQLVECLCVFFITSIGYLIIGEPYAFLLGFFAGICVLIPYIGTFIGMLPALAVAIPFGLTKVIFVVIVVVIAQQLDVNFVYPNIIGKAIKVSPLTITIILLAAGRLGGLFGMLLAVPLYAMAKVVVEYLYNIWHLRHINKSKKLSESINTNLDKLPKENITTQIDTLNINNLDNHPTDPSNSPHPNSSSNKKDDQ